MVRFSAALATFETDLPPLIAQWWESELSGIPVGAEATASGSVARRHGRQATTGQWKRRKSTNSA